VTTKQSPVHESFALGVCYGNNPLLSDFNYWAVSDAGNAKAMNDAASETHSAQRDKLLRILGLGFGLAVVVGGTIGVSIFRLPGPTAALLGNPWLILAVWTFGGIFILLNANYTAELATMIPKAGGPYVYARHAYGDFAGFIVAVALVRPTKSIYDVDVRAVKKKMKDKAFARAVNRDDIVRGADELGMPLDDVIANVIAAPKADAVRLGLAGSEC
jgi:hypothetical protein